ncbi:RibD family protein [Methylobacterium sp. NEAU K]|uniref:RibD family protein n=1 Tax=Methylobacterium sp. NEAU K TaxID=3064946 RepID=UPI0027345279|nr:RibD family protein [Methylobacterium sp. NEAU K]MDP4006173.1 RibD family protein [Methylobacterium sp. NEAU K]
MGATTCSVFAAFETGTAQRPFVVAQLGQSLDGRIATPSGDSKYINLCPALDHLHRIRARVDAVVVGIGTVIADDPLLTVRRVEGASPARIVLDPSGRIPPSARFLAEDGVRRLVVCRTDATVPPSAESVRMEDETSFCPRAVIARLGALGFRRILVEGGARTVSAFIDAGAIDRLHLMVAPMLMGSGRSGLDLRPISALSEAMRPVTRSYHLGEGEVLFDCDLRSRFEGGTAS